jgi:ATP adenylyltransferase
MEYFFNFEKMAYVRNLKGDECILCGLVKHTGASPDLTVYEDDLFNVVVNLYPYNPGHVMIFPRRHLEDIRDYTGEEALALHKLTRTCLGTLDKVYRPSAYNLGYNMGGDAGASIQHLHLHIIPRYPRELGIADIVAGKRVLVESPLTSAEKIKAAFPAPELPCPGG